jgi:hypothetical protein
MKRIIAVALGLLTVAAGAHAQTPAQTIERALAPLSARAAEGAAVIQFNADGSYTTLKEGSGPWVCYDRSGQPGRAPFAVQCTNTGNLERLSQNMRLAAAAAGDNDALRSSVAAAVEGGRRVDAVFGSAWVSMNGPDQASAGRHVTIAVPYATAESLGLPDNGRAGGAWIMAGGTSEAHIMVP